MMPTMSSFCLNTLPSSSYWWSFTVIVYLHRNTLNSQSKCRNITEMIEVNRRVLEPNVLMDPRKGVGLITRQLLVPIPIRDPIPISPLQLVCTHYWCVKDKFTIASRCVCKYFCFLETIRNHVEHFFIMQPSNSGILQDVRMVTEKLETVKF